MTQDPTRTVTIRARWISQFNKRYRKLKGEINLFILHNTVTVNQTFDFGSDATAVAEFLAWLQTRIDADIFDNALRVEDMWQNQFIDQAYQRGVFIASVELRKQGADVAGLLRTVQPAQIAGVAPFAFGGALTLSDTTHLDAVQLIYTRDFEALKGITNEMSKQIAGVLTEGVEEGQGARQIAKNINDRVNRIGVTRSRLLARTETVRAYNIANINESLVTEQQTDMSIKQRWVTAGDERVRNTHAHRNQKIFEPKVARGLIGEPNCRCSLVPFIEEIDDAADQAERSEDRAKGLAIIGQTG